MNKSRVYLLLTTCFITNPCYSQNKFGAGFYIGVAGDTTKAFIKYQNDYDRHVPIRKGRHAKTEYLTADQIAYFALKDGGLYKSLQVAELSPASVFAEVLLEGTIDLIKVQDRLLLEGNEKFLLSKIKAKSPEESLASLRRNIGYFNIQFADCPTVLQKVPRTNLNESIIIELLKEYHECKNSPVQFQKKTPKWKTNLGIFGGYGSSALTFGAQESVQYEFLPFSDFGKYKGSTMGITFLSMWRHPSPIIGFQGELMFSNGEFSTTTYREWTVETNELKEWTQSEIKYSRMTFKVGPRIVLRSNFINPYFSGGISFSSKGSVTSKTIYTVNVNDYSETKEFETLASVNGLGTWAQIGIKKNLWVGMLYLEACYDTGIVPNNGRITMTQARAGYLFNLTRIQPKVSFAHLTE